MFDGLDFVAMSATFVLMVASPGPATIAVATLSMRAGRPAGLRFGLGLSVGHVFWGTFAASGVGAMLETAAHLLVILKVLGGTYLLWLAYTFLRAAMQQAPHSHTADRGQAWFGQSLFLNLSNPKVVIAWMAVLSIGASPEAGAISIIAATLLCIGLAFVTNALYAVAFSTATAMRAYAVMRRWVEGIAALLFSIAGASLIMSTF